MLAQAVKLVRNASRMGKFRVIMVAILGLMLIHYLSFVDIHSKNKEPVVITDSASSNKLNRTPNPIPVVNMERISGNREDISKQLNTNNDILQTNYDKYSKSLPSLESLKGGKFLFCSIALENSVSKSLMVESLLRAQNDFLPNEIVILVFANKRSSYLDKLAANRNVFILDSAQCRQNSRLKVDCVMTSAFSASDQFFSANSIKLTSESALFLFTNGNSDQIFNSNFGQGISFLLNSYNINNLAIVGSQLTTSDISLFESIRSKALLSFTSNNEDSYKGLDELIASNLRKITTNTSHYRQIFAPEQSFFLIFSKKNFPSEFPSYLLGRDSFWCQHLANHFNNAREGFSFIDVSNSVYLLDTGPKTRDPFETSDKIIRSNDLKLYRDFFQDKITFNQMEFIKLSLQGCPGHCIVKVIQDSSESHVLGETLQVVQKIKSNKNALVTLIAVSELTLKNTLNWICWAKSAGYLSFLFITESSLVANKLRSLGEEVVYVAQSDPFYSQAISSTMTELDRLSVLLGEIQLICLQKKIKAIIMSPYLLLINDISTNLVTDISDSCDVILLMEALEALTYVKPTVSGELLMRSLIDYRNKYPSKLSSDMKKGTYNYDIYKNIFTVKNKLSLDLRICKFSRGNIVNSDFYFRNPLKRFGNAPFAFNLNVPDSKFLNVWSENDNKCVLPATIGSTEYNDRASWTLRIRVLTSYRAKSLDRLLKSIVNADYDSAGYMRPIPIDIVVDFPNISTLDSDYAQAIENNKKVRDLVNAFKWDRGPVNVSIHNYTHGIVYAWLNSRLKPNELLMVLEDDMELSSMYYKYLVKAINHFYVNPKNYNPLAVGLSFQRQYHIVGETIFAYYEPYGPKIIDLTLGKNTIYYKYQLISSWGPVLFPKPWNDFIDWVDEKVRTHKTIQCVPFLFSNKWALSGNVWTPFASRFIFEKGLFMIYHHSPFNSAFVTNHKEPGLHFSNKTKKEGIVPLIESRQAFQFLVNSMPPQKFMKLFDFHFREVTSENSLVLRNRFIDHGLDSCITVQRSKNKNKKKPSKKGNK